MRRESDRCRQPKQRVIVLHRGTVGGGQMAVKASGQGLVQARRDEFQTPQWFRKKDTKDSRLLSAAFSRYSSAQKETLA